MISPETLRRYPHFAGVSDGSLKSIAMISDERSFKSNEKLFSESGELKAGTQVYEKGDEATFLLLLTEGQVDIVFSVRDGENIVVDTLVSGDLMAISALIPPHQLAASGIARQDGKLIQIKAPELRQLCEDVPELGYRLMLQVAKTAKSRLSQARVQLAAQG